MGPANVEWSCFVQKCYHEAEALALGNELIKEVENSKMQEGEKADKNREKRAMKKV